LNQIDLRRVAQHRLLVSGNDGLRRHFCVVKVVLNICDGLGRLQVDQSLQHLGLMLEARHEFGIEKVMSFAQQILQVGLEILLRVF